MMNSTALPHLPGIPLSCPSRSLRFDKRKHCRFFSIGIVCRNGLRGDCRQKHDAHVRQDALTRLLTLNINFGVMEVRQQHQLLQESYLANPPEGDSVLGLLSQHNV